ncbi:MULTISPECIES: RNA polymerase sigma factor [Butyricimonas]|uniref:RNA polymerase sigma factor n=1 Tax=Butyricimonas TaxID=574697 RepID=UPI0007FB59C4|nr:MULTISPECIES: sigma-70 family RNA polymerase sigma factor [Butyricimonas]
MHDDESRFISNINAKKEIAWKKLYRSYYPALCHYASRMIQDEVSVEDIVQECFIKLWDSPVTFSNIRSLTGWLYQAVYTRTLNLIRDQARTNKLRQDLLSAGEEPTEEEAINSAIEEEILHKFRMILTQLSPQQQEIMKMSMEGMKVKEIAETLQVSENAIKMQKKRAYATIREELGECWSILLVASFPNLF